MIDTVLNITVGYLALGTLVLPVIFGMEYLRVQAKGPEFKKWLNRVLGESEGPLSGRKAFMALLRWPMFLFSTLVAFFKGQTLLEYIAKSIERQKKRAAEVRQHTLDILEDRIPISRDWFTHHPDVPEILAIHFYRAQFTMEVISSHLVVEVEGAATCWRSVDKDPKRNLPLAHFATLREAKKHCETDDVWLAVSRPGMEAEREELWAKEIERFEEEVELNKMASEVIEEQDPNEVALDDAYDPPQEGKVLKTD